MTNNGYGHPQEFNAFLAQAYPPIRSIIEPGLLTYGGYMMIYGATSTYKTWLVLDMAHAVTTGRDWLGYKTNKARVLMVQVEMTPMMYQDRAKKLHARGGIPTGAFWLLNDETLKLYDYAGQNELEAAIRDTACDLVIIDCLYRVLSSQESDAVLVGRMLDFFARLRQKYGCAFVLVHHTRKQQRGNEGDTPDAGVEESRGSQGLGDWPDTTIRLTAVSGGIQLDVQKHRLMTYAPMPLTVRLQPDMSFCPE